MGHKTIPTNEKFTLKMFDRHRDMVVANLDMKTQ